MARKIHTPTPEPEDENNETPIVDSPEESAPTPLEETIQPVPIVELEDVIQAESLSPAEQQQGVRFFFGEIGLLTFPDKTTYHIKGRNAFVTDPQVIENLKAYAEANPTAKIFIQ